jgi:hypothetical protein
MAYGPTPLLAVAVVVKLALPLTALLGSLFTKPAMLSLKLGLALPYTFVLPLAVTVSVAGVTANVPVAKVNE